MTELTYTPDDDITVHKEGAIRLLCRAFQSHENGLPEWLKNSADAYAGENAPEAKRVIVVIFDHGRRGSRRSISCLDFAGMTSNIIEENFRIWADPEAARRGRAPDGVQGGHGNGGKCYMTQMFEDFAVLHTAKSSKCNLYGVPGGSIKFGYVPDRKLGRDVPISDLHTELQKALSRARCSWEILPLAAVQAIELADGFTLVTGVGPKGYDRRSLRSLINTLQQHPQMIRTLELCQVYVIVDNKPFLQGKPLHLPDIKPIQGAEVPREVPIPTFLTDPDTHVPVSTTADDSFPEGLLVLRTSEINMRSRRKGRHNIIYRTASGYIGYVPVPELDVVSPYRDRIYGDCHLGALEPFKQNDRARLAQSPLTRAVEQFLAQEVDTYSKELEARDRRRHGQEEKNALSKMNEALDRWKNLILNELVQGLWGSDGNGPPPSPPPLPSGKPARLELGLPYHKAGRGVAFRPSLKSYDDAGRRIRPVPFRWISDDTRTARADDDLMIINTYALGKTNIFAETIDQNLQSNKVPLEVVQIDKIQITPSRIEVPAGSRQKLEAVCRLTNNELATDVCLVWTESNPNVARVSAAGLVFGFTPGTTDVVAGDDTCLAENAAVVHVTPGQGRGPGGQRGRGYPRVLISEFDLDPETDEAVNFSPEDPPVGQRPVDVERNIWWINSAAPFARLYLDADRGYGYQSREWRIYHLERLIDIMVQIALIYSPQEIQDLSVNDWIMKWGDQLAEIQAAAAPALSEFVATGKLPKA